MSVSGWALLPTASEQHHKEEHSPETQEHRIHQLFFIVSSFDASIVLKEVLIELLPSFPPIFLGLLRHILSLSFQILRLESEFLPRLLRFLPRVFKELFPLLLLIGGPLLIFLALASRPLRPPLSLA